MRVLVVGGTGNVGSRVANYLLKDGHEVSVLVRESSVVPPFPAGRVRLAPGDLTDRSSLRRAVRGAEAVVTTAQGYGRRPTDSLETVDDLGNRNLVEAAREEGVSRFVFNSILQCDLAVDVPHFYQKKRTEDYLESKQVPFVSLRPGAYLGGMPWLSEPLRQGMLPGLGPEDVPWTYIHPDDVARALAAAVVHPDIVWKKIDLGTDRAMSRRDLAGVFQTVSGRPFSLGSFGGGRGTFTAKQAHDFQAMADFFATGKYVADTALQTRFFPPVRSVEETVARVLAEAGLGPVREH